MSGFVFGASGATALLILWIGWSRAGELALAAVKGFDPLAWVAPLAVLGEVHVLSTKDGRRETGAAHEMRCMPAFSRACSRA